MPAVPPPGRILQFRDWATIVRDGVRKRVPDVTAMRRGGGVVVLRCRGRSATIVDEKDGRWVTFAAEGGVTTTMASLCDRDRGDAFTASNIAKTIAGFFDAEQSLPE